MSELAKILIVDDNPKYLQDALPMYGYEVKVAIEEVQPVEQSQALESRRIANENGNEPVVILSADEVKEVTENQGFSF